MTEQEIIDEGKKIFEWTANKLPTIKQIPTTLLLFSKNDKRERICIDDLCNICHQPPGRVVASVIKPVTRNNKNIIGVMFLMEGWALESSLIPGKSPPHIQEELKKVARGEIKISESEYKIDTLNAVVETRGGLCLQLMYAIATNDKGRRSKSDKLICTDDPKMTLGGNCIGFFKDLPPEKGCGDPNCTHCHGGDDD